MLKSIIMIGNCNIEQNSKRNYYRGETIGLRFRGGGDLNLDNYDFTVRLINGKSVSKYRKGVDVIGENNSYTLTIQPEVSKDMALGKYDMEILLVDTDTVITTVKGIINVLDSYSKEGL